MKEYCIYIQQGSACPYRTVPYNSFEKAREALLIMISDYDYRRKIYYIDNDFFENKYMLGLPKQIYFQIQERNVENWAKYGTNDKLENKNKSKIIKFEKRY